MKYYPFPIYLIGPTCAGKSDIALEFAHTILTEIISCDSMQVYKGMDIGTAKPSFEIQQQIHHHMIDICSIDQEYDVNQYTDDAQKCINQCLKREKTPLIVGGTGMYYRALVDGLCNGLGKNDAVRAQLLECIEKEGNEKVFNRLKNIDPAAAKKISINDTRRIIRALEVYELTGRPISMHHGQWDVKNKACVVGLSYERSALYKRINERVDAMFLQGLVDEVQQLLEQGMQNNKTAMQAIGYKEVVSYIQGACTLETCTDRVKQSTRRFAKRQLTWFRKDDRVKWIDVVDGIDGIIEAMLTYICDYHRNNNEK